MQFALAIKNITVKVFLLIFLQCTVRTRPVTVDRVRYISHRFADDNGIFIPPFYNMREADLPVMKKKKRKKPGEIYSCSPYQVPLKKYI